MREFLDTSVVCLTFAAIIATATGCGDAWALTAAALVAALADLIYRGSKEK